MEFGLKSTRASIALALLCAFCGACQKDGTAPTTAPEMSALHATVASVPTAAAATANTNGAAGQMPAFYDDQLFTVNMKELPGDASAAIIAKNQSMNEIYATNDLDDEQDFTPVLDAIQGDGFNPLWRQNLIVFNAGFAPHQFTSDTDVLAAAGGSNPEITIVPTDEVYRCSVVGKK
jgi:hypothetical protein